MGNLTDIGSPSILVDGWYGVGNVGDEAILASIIELIRESYDSPEITAFSYDPTYTRDLHDVDHAVNRFAFSLTEYEWLTAIHHADELWIGGGGILDQNSVQHAILVATARMFDTRVVFLSVGASEYDFSKDIFNMTGAMLDHASVITVRDHQSAENLRETGVDNVNVIPDPVFASNWETARTHDAVNEETVVVVLTNPPDCDTDFEGLVRGLNRFESNMDCEYLFLPFNHDSSVARKVNANLKNPGSVLGGAVKYSTAFEILNSARLVVGMRLHSVIMSKQAETPVVGIAYHPKCKAHLELLGEAVIWCNDIDPEALHSTMVSKWEANESTEDETLWEITESAASLVTHVRSRDDACSRLRLPELIGKTLPTPLLDRFFYGNE